MYCVRLKKCILCRNVRVDMSSDKVSKAAVPERFSGRPTYEFGGYPPRPKKQLSYSKNTDCIGDFLECC